MTQTTPDKPAVKPEPPLAEAVVAGVERQGRGVTASAGGLAVALVIVVALLVTAQVAGGNLSALALPGLLTAAAAAIVWLATLSAYLLRRQAAVEDVELDELRRSGRADEALFADQADARPAARRVRRAYRYLLPAAAALAALVLLVPAVLLGINQVRAGGAPLPGNGAATAAALAGLAFLAFVAGRWLAGLARRDHLRLLRGGGSMLTGTALLLLVGAVGFGVADFGEGESRVLIALRLAVLVNLAVAAVLGVEFLVNLLLDLYRPRRPGEEPRPAFDSRLLGVFGAPGGAVASLNEAINYQFGFDVTGGLLYRLVTRALAWLVLGGLLALLLLSSVYVVEPHQQAIETGVGGASGPHGPGLHLKAPWPVGRVELYDTERLRTLRIGSHGDRAPDAPPTPAAAAPLLFDNEHSQDETLFVLAAPGATEDGTPGVALASAEVLVSYRIGDLAEYLRANPYAEPGTEDDGAGDRLFRQLAEEAAHRQMQTVTLDGLLGPQRLALAARIEADLSAAAGRAGLGVEVVDVGVAGAHYDRSLADAFAEAEAAPVRADARVAEGRLEATRALTASAGTAEAANQIVEAIDDYRQLQRADADPAEIEAAAGRVQDLIAGAEGAAAELLNAARADRLQRVLREEGRLDEFEGQRAAFATAPELHRTRRLFDELQEVLPEARVYLLAAEPGRVDVRLDMSEGAGGGISLPTN